MRFNTILSLVLTSLLIITSCTHQTKQSSPSLTITVEEPDRIRFHGKGAGAGMMLTSAMGPMGIAIGAAIDEGIGKEIDEAARSAGFNIEESIQNAFAMAWKKEPGTQQEITLHIKRYGFVLRSGENDPVAPELHAVLVQSGENQVVKYPDDFVDESVSTIPLEVAKRDGVAVNELMREVASLLVEKIVRVEL